MTLASLHFIPTSFDERKQLGYRSSEPVASVVSLTAEEADWILANCNKKNRVITPSNRQKIRRAIGTSGYVYDGCSIAFYTCGNLHDGQHRLTELRDYINDHGPVPVVMAWGADPDAGALCSNGKPRSQREEIERHDKSITADLAYTVADIAIRRNERDCWQLSNCLRYWNQWKNYAQRGLELTAELDTTEKFSAQRKALRAFASLCAASGNIEKDAASLLNLLTLQILGEESCRLAESFLQQWDAMGDVANEPKLSALFNMLCQALDRYRKSPDGVLALEYVTERHSWTKQRLLS